MSSMWQIIKQTSVRIGVWSAHGCILGLQCGAMVGAMQGLPVSAVIYYPFFLRRGGSRFSSPSHAWEMFVVNTLLSTFTFAVLGTVIGSIIGASIFVALSFVIRICGRPTAALSEDRKILKFSAMGSFIGGFCCASSWCLLSAILKRDISAEVGNVLVVYIVGAVGGFAVGFFIGARNIIREETARESSTR